MIPSLHAAAVFGESVGAPREPWQECATHDKAGEPCKIVGVKWGFGALWFCLCWNWNAVALMRYGRLLAQLEKEGAAPV